jgi:EAL domain-containing protein (putative c-di-GMP-specific phosphodiesterase class I)
VLTDLALATDHLSRLRELGVVGEGVETAAQLEVLRAAGCEAFQGYLFARPGPVDQLVALVRSAAVA